MFDRVPVMPCPSCHCHRVEPLDGSTRVLAWYSCRHCGELWSARLRDGQPATVWIDGSAVRAPADSGGTWMRFKSEGPHVTPTPDPTYMSVLWLDPRRHAGEGDHDK